jgi:hypothetical protein
MEEKHSEGPTESVLASLKQLVKEAQRGNPEVLPQIRGILDRYPEIWQHYGDLAKHNEYNWIGLLAANDASVRESLERTTEELRTELSAAGSSSLERLLIDRIVVSQLMTNFFDSALALVVDGSESKVRYLQQQLDRAQRRYLGAIKSLAEVRKLLPQS